MVKRYKVTLNGELCIVRVGDKSLLAIRPKSVIEMVVLRILSY